MSRRNANTTKVFVGSLPPNVTTEDLRRLFAPFGKIVECDIANRCGFLHLEDKDLAEKAIAELNNSNFMGGRISVERGRVKPPRRNRDGGPGPGRGGRDRGGPYSRNNGFSRGPPRNGMGYGNRDYSYPDRYGDYVRAMPLRNYDPEYDSIPERRPMYDDQDYMDDRRRYAPPNGFDRHPYDDLAYPSDRGGYDDRRLPPPLTAPISDAYDDRRPLMGERRPLLEQSAVPPRSSMGGYERNSSGNDMFSRRSDSASKSGLSIASGGYGDREPQIGSYGNSGISSGGYSTIEGSYGSSSANLDTGYSSGVGGGSGGGYGTSGSYSTAGYSDNRASDEYSTNPTVSSGGGYDSSLDNSGYSTGISGGYGDSFGGNGRGVGGSYDSMYSLSQQRSYASGAGGSGPRRDISTGPGRRY